MTITTGSAFSNILNQEAKLVLQERVLRLNGNTDFSIIDLSFTGMLYIYNTLHWTFFGISNCPLIEMNHFVAGIAREALIPPCDNLFEDRLRNPLRKQWKRQNIFFLSREL